jgi:hypothetical protein
MINALLNVADIGLVLSLSTGGDMQLHVTYFLFNHKWSLDVC